MQDTSQGVHSRRVPLYIITSHVTWQKTINLVNIPRYVVVTIVDEIPLNSQTCFFFSPAIWQETKESCGQIMNKSLKSFLKKV